MTLPTRLREYADFCDQQEYACNLHMADTMREAAGVVERYRAWIERTANDPNLRTTKAGYHARRVRLEAVAILEGKDVPAKRKETT